MKIQRINNTDYKVYFYQYKEEESLYEDCKSLIKKLQKRLRLKGFYKVIIFPSKIGLFFQLIKVEDSLYKNILDLKIEISADDVYFKTNDYFLIKDFSPIRYIDGEYYCIVEESFDEILEKVEFGEFVFGYDIYDLLDSSYVI